MDKLKTYESFDGDQNDEEKIDEVMQSMINKKHIISALGDTINYVSKQIEKTLPLQIAEFMQDLYHYDAVVYEMVDHIKDKLIDGYPNIKDTIEEIEKEFSSIESYMKLKKNK